MRFEPSQSADFATALQGGGRLLGLDLGTKTIGLAVSDADWSIASPVRTIRRTKFTDDARDMLTYAQENAIAGFVLGLPLNMDETEGPRAQSTRAFARSLAPLSPLPLLFWDERLSTVAADMALSKRARRNRADTIDAVAASLILRSALDALRALPAHDMSG